MQMGLDALPKFTKPEGTSDADFREMKDQMNQVFNAAIGVAASQDKDYPTAIKCLHVAVDGTPQDFSVVYPLALAYLGQTPPDYVNGIWYAARALAIGPPEMQAQLEKYARSQYVKYHGGDDGWADVLAVAKANGPRPRLSPCPLQPSKPTR